MSKIINKAFVFLLAFFILITAIPLPSQAAEADRSYEFDLTVNGAHEVYAEPGDILTVVLTLHRTDSEKTAKMYGMQDEIRYDPNFFEIVEGGALTADGIEIRDIGLIDDYRAFYVNFLSLGGGADWEAETMVGSFQVKVLGENGSSYLKNENCKVSFKDGSGSYETSVQDLLVIVSSECIVKFDSMGGSEVPTQAVPFGEHAKKPEDPVREGYTFKGWYKDIYLKEEWDFDKDTVIDNMTLFAGWQTGTVTADDSSGFPWWSLLVLLYILILLFLIFLFKKPKIEFMLDEENVYQTVKVYRGKYLKKPKDPFKDGALFGGWYLDDTFEKAWDFENDKVKKSMKLYAKWVQ